MKARYTKFDMLYLLKTLKIKLKKSTLGRNVAGKKLPTAHAINTFINMSDVIRQFFSNRLVDNQRSIFVDLPDKILKRLNQTGMISIDVEVVRISGGHYSNFGKQPQKRTVKFIRFHYNKCIAVHFAVHHEIGTIV